MAPITETFDPENPPNPYVIKWDGFATDASGNVTYLQRGDYTIAIEGVKKDDTTVKTAEDDPNAKVSLVEVTKVELLPAAGDARPDTLSDNPGVPSVEGQSPPQGRPAEGKRIFAEALSPTGTVFDRVKVRATVDPKVSDLRGQEPIKIYFRPLDVDDPAEKDPVTGTPNLADADFDVNPLKVEDNRGSPREGVVSDPSPTLSAGATQTETQLEVSVQPGDNYRVVASTAQTWLQGLRGYQPSMVGEVRYADGTAGGRILTEEELKAVSDMLTVWRTLHLEVDSMMPPPSSPTDPQRNFLQGEGGGHRGSEDGTRRGPAADACDSRS